ncbi:Guanine nucleotide-binding protein-like 3 [Tetrabaena socialis]|uniref:Guanine nucleotide-binding protein-like 3 n=1 Tax=Tetrabaena socialis TaxID=47790 RepID=A0A2J8A6V2_9CHLO|nr:Guanine nucleotide-binding protein-like 3 [Tetrabaena socialis]|eukprot:PNH08262.1 Guanine nucleotide-binding protein-like 3 [Tetrabaena socialis]
MPKKSTKSKSKRMTLRQKYKVIRKIKEHHKKIRKDEKKSAKSGKKKKPVKDPGLPSQWPFKEELVKEFAFLRAKAQADEKRKKEERKLSRQHLQLLSGS